MFLGSGRVWAAQPILDLVGSWSCFSMLCWQLQVAPQHWQALDPHWLLLYHWSHFKGSRMGGQSPPVSYFTVKERYTLPHTLNQFFSSWSSLIFFTFAVLSFMSSVNCCSDLKTFYKLTVRTFEFWSFFFLRNTCWTQTLPHLPSSDPSSAFNYPLLIVL